ncbi:endoplasmic reticulum metallopeptidase 1-like [Anopheles ziemanni]|uniref:endoplasmic reticulum metallopeptidase 1-like n=1 Tax=Anopheles coustani TaxID=139045 RepID=UPI002659EA09|nr:endoplasmic reticulum metallopeptidase 1-like [Anopheles coustani]XP_058178825.1 endoplasmic reticulum metallopeptidase 1-like [Anopheles ziemanni]
MGKLLTYVLHIELLWCLLGPCVGIGIYLLTYLNWNTLPSGVNLRNDVDGRFVAERALNDLATLVSRGPRVAGSETNERFAVDFLLNTVAQIQRDASSEFEISYGVQQAQGSYWLDYEDYPITSVYRGVQNVVVTIVRKSGFSGKYLLLNAHYDSAVSSPGAGDDGTMVVVMLEILRQLSRSDGANLLWQHGLIFLFNGCEENTMQGAHGFVRGHPLASNVVAFLNLDVAANGGREIMFQSGPNYPFLMSYYRDHVSRPYANTLGEEVFQMGLVPSFTDYETLSKVGGWPGLDFALSSYGYLYHTALDALETISPDTLQHIGDNILGLVQGLVNADELSDIETHREGTAVFFDFMHLFLVYYTETVGLIINCLLGTLSLGLIIGTLVMMIRKDGAACTNILFEAGMSLIVQTLSIVLGAGLSVLVAVIFDACSRSMSWFSSTWLLFGLYFVPFIAGMTLGPFLYVHFRKIPFLHDQGRAILFLHAQHFIYAILLITLSIGGIRSAFILLFPVIFYSASTIVNMIIQFRLRIWIYVHLVGQLIPFVYFCSLTVTLFAVFISMTGRSDNRSNPDLQMALFASLMALLLVGMLTPFIVLFRRKVYVFGTLLLMFLVTGIVAATPHGFPFRERSSPQRYYIFHQQRNFYWSNGTLRDTNSIFYLHPQDRHTPDQLQAEVSAWQAARPLGEECERELYCGIPFYINRYHRQSERSYWLPASTAPNFPEPVQLQLASETSSPGRRRLNFLLRGPSHMSLYVSPLFGRKLVSWSFSETIPPSGKRWNDQDVYFVNLFSGGMENTRQWEFYIEVDRLLEGPVDFYLTVVAQYMHHGAVHHTQEFQELLNQMPPYAHTVAYPGYLESRVY